jgi:hypothetical protein
MFPPPLPPGGTLDDPINTEPNEPSYDKSLLPAGTWNMLGFSFEGSAPNRVVFGKTFSLSGGPYERNWIQISYRSIFGDINGSNQKENGKTD